MTERILHPLRCPHPDCGRELEPRAKQTIENNRMDYHIELVHKDDGKPICE